MNAPISVEDKEIQGRPRPGEHLPREGSKKRWWLWLLVLALLGYGGYRLRERLGQKPPSSAGQAASSGPRGVPVVAATARIGNMPLYLRGLGSVTPIYTVTVKSRVDGQLMRVLYREGDIVHQGNLLAEIDSRPYEVQLEQAQGQLLKDQAALANARIDLNRYQTLLTHNAIAEQQVATQKAAITQDEGAVTSDQAQIDGAKLNIVYCHVTAPITGRIGLRLVDPGNMVHATDANGLLVITQIQPISVIFTIAEDQLPVVLKRTRAGQRLRVDTFDRTMTTKIATGSLTTIDNQIDQATGTVRLRATFDNKDNALFPNQFVNARLLVEEKHGVTLVPTATVQRNSQTTYVYIVKPDSTVSVRPVAIGTTEGEDSEVTSGLSPGEVVVMTGVDKLQEGSKVTVQIYGGKTQKGS
jgi:multidrug efflux system membrane fusion protein